MEYPTRKSIIDLGSNSVRMNIYGIGQAHDYIQMDQAKEKVRLSEGMGRELVIKQAPLARLSATLALFAQLNRVYRVEECHCLATAAVRTSTNQAQVLERIEQESGFRFQVLSGQEEAELDYLGVVNTMAVDNALLVDLGGASTEIILVEDRKMKQAVSLPFGSVNLSENYQTERAARHKMRQELSNLDWLDQASGYEIIGLGGSIRTLAKVNRAKQHWPLFSIHNYQMTVDEVRQVLGLIHRLPVSRLAGVPGISSSRADILKRGLAPFVELLRMVEPKHLRISTSGLREGFFYTKYHTNRGLPLVSQNVLDDALVNLERRYRLNREHCAYVTRLSLELFDHLGEDFEPEDRLLLEVAARVHDIGMHVDYYSHHLHGFYLILQSNLSGLSDRQLIKVALLVGYHRQKPNLFDLRPFIQIVGRETHKRMKQLSLFLSLAEQLDRSESQKIKAIEWKDGILAFRLKPGYESSLEEQAAAVSLKQLQEKYRVKLVFL